MGMSVCNLVISSCFVWLVGFQLGQLKHRNGSRGFKPQHFSLPNLCLMPVWLVGRQIQDRCSLVLNVGCSPHLWLVIVTQSPATLLKDCSPKWVTVSCRLACAGGTVIPRFQQNDCDQHSDAPREGNKASLPLVPPLNIRMVCAFLFLNLSFFFSLLNLFQM